jgi:hypothetical protein
MMSDLRKAAEQALKPGEPTCKPTLQVHTTGWVAPKDRYAVPVLFNPYTGEPRDVRDVQSDPQGILIVPPGKVDMLAAPPAQTPPRLGEDEVEYPHPPAKPPVYATAANTKAVRDGFEMGGYEKEPGYYSEAQLDEFARAIETAVRRQFLGKDE